MSAHQALVYWASQAPTWEATPAEQAQAAGLHVSNIYRYRKMVTEGLAELAQVPPAERAPYLTFWWDIPIDQAATIVKMWSK